MADGIVKQRINKALVQHQHRDDDDWRHLSILLTPENPEFEAMEFGPEDEQRQFRVLAEFVRVLEEDL